MWSTGYNTVRPGLLPLPARLAVVLVPLHRLLSQNALLLSPWPADWSVEVVIPCTCISAYAYHARTHMHACAQTSTGHLTPTQSPVPNLHDSRACMRTDVHRHPGHGLPDPQPGAREHQGLLRPDRRRPHILGGRIQGGALLPQTRAQLQGLRARSKLAGLPSSMGISGAVIACAHLRHNARPGAPRLGPSYITRGHHGPFERAAPKEPVRTAHGTRMHVLCCMQQSMVSC